MGKLVLFYLILSAELLLILAGAISILVPERRIYPPAKKHSWQNYSYLGLHFLSVIGFFVIGGLDWNTYVLRHLAWRVIGGLLFGTGLVIAFWAVAVLSMRRSIGYDIVLIHDGFYKVTRNPQIMGQWIATVGFVLLANSLLTLIIGVLSMIYIGLTVFPEEQWLLELIGPDYEAYLADTRRFL